MRVPFECTIIAMPESLAVLSLRDVATVPFALAIREAYERYGFVVIADHGIAPQLLTEFEVLFRNFFALPEARKRTYHLPGGGGARGYTPFGIETAKDSRHADLKEFWHIGRELPAGHRYRPSMPENIWAAELPGFRDISLALMAALDHIGRQLLAAIARSLQLSSDFFEDKVNEGNSVLRVIHYPAMPAHATESVRAGAHEDINVITLLLGAAEPGLQILDRNQRWLAINPAPGTLVCNVGDMLQRLTNGVLRSTTHRVVNPASDRAGFARYSMPYFLHFNPDFLIRTLPNCISRSHPNLYPDPITADAYLRERLREIKLL